MGRRAKFVSMLLAVAAAAILAVGCGGDDETTAGGAAAAVEQTNPDSQGGDSTQQESQGTDDSAPQPEEESDGAAAGDGGDTAGGGGGQGNVGAGEGEQKSPAGGSEDSSAEFDAPGGYATFGEEASASEREQASAVLEEYMSARDAGQWQRACATLNRNAVEPVEKLLEEPGQGCVKTLTTVGNRVPDSTWTNLMAGPIGSLRVTEGGGGYALYHGTDGNDYVISMAREGDTWKVSDLEPNGWEP